MRTNGTAARASSATTRARRAPTTSPRRGAGLSLGRGSGGNRRWSGAGSKRAGGGLPALALPQVSLPQISLPKLPRLGQLRPLPVLGTIGSHAFRVGRALPNSPLVDRLLRGRAWIGLVAVLLLGLVGVNVSLLKLNAAAGRNAERVKSLQIQNDRLRAQASRLGSGDRVERVARKLGLVMPDAGAVRYLTARPGDGQLAARALRAGARVPGSAPLQDTVKATPLAAVPAPAPIVLAPAGATGPAGAPSPTGSATGAPATGAQTGVTQALPTQQPATGQTPAGAATGAGATGGSAGGAGVQPGGSPPAG